MRPFVLRLPHPGTRRLPPRRQASLRATVRAFLRARGRAFAEGVAGGVSNLGKWESVAGAERFMIDAAFAGPFLTSFSLAPALPQNRRIQLQRLFSSGPSCGHPYPILCHGVKPAAVAFQRGLLAG